MDIIKKAKDFAIECHGDQKYGDHAYSFHLIGVAKLVDFYTQLCPVSISVAYLHDVLEDTDTPICVLREMFGSVISDSVLALTDRAGFNRYTRQLATYSYTRKNKVALLVKLCDRLFNMREAVGTDLAKMYLKEYTRFKFALYDEEHDKTIVHLWQDLDRAHDALKDS